MNFRLFYESAFMYSPPRDKSRLLFDFYMLAYLNSVVTEQERQEGELTLKGPSKDQLRLKLDDVDMIQHAYKTVVERLRKHMLAAVYYSIVSELRHFYSSASSTALDLDGYEREDAENAMSDAHFDMEREYPPMKKVAKAMAKTPRYGSVDRRILIKLLDNTDMEPEDIVDMAGKAFYSYGFPWQEEYGGGAWMKITQGWEKLFYSSNVKNAAVAIDHLYDLQHNNGSVLDKLKEYGNWMTLALDFKRDIKDFNSLLPFVSPALKRKAQSILHLSGHEKTHESKSINKTSKAVQISYGVLEDNGFTPWFKEEGMEIQEGEVNSNWFIPDEMKKRMYVQMEKDLRDEWGKYIDGRLDLSEFDPNMYASVIIRDGTIHRIKLKLSLWPTRQPGLKGQKGHKGTYFNVPVNSRIDDRTASVNFNVWSEVRNQGQQSPDEIVAAFLNNKWEIEVLPEYPSIPRLREMQ